MGKRWSRPVRWFLFFAGLILVYQVACHMPLLVDGVRRFLGIIAPFLVGFALAYLLQIPCIKIEQRFQASSKKFLQKRARTLSVWTVVVGLLLILAATVSVVVPGVMKGIQGVIDALPEYYGQVKKWVQAINNSRLLDFQIDLDALLGRVPFEEKIQSIMRSENAAAYAQGLVGASKFIVNAVLAFITAVYILLYRRQLKRMAAMLLDLAKPKKHQELLIRYMGKIHEYFAKFVLCQMLDAGLLGAVMTVVFYLTGVEYAGLLGPLVGVGNLVPCFGAIVGRGRGGDCHPLDRRGERGSHCRDFAHRGTADRWQYRTAQIAERFAEAQSASGHYRNHSRRRLFRTPGDALGDPCGSAVENYCARSDPVQT